MTIELRGNRLIVEMPDSVWVIRKDEGDVFPSCYAEHPHRVEMDLDPVFAQRVREMGIVVSAEQEVKHEQD